MFQIRFLVVYLEFFKGDKYDFNIFRIVIFGFFYYFYYFLLSLWVVITYLGEL
jgi:hypothetical protein